MTTATVLASAPRPTRTLTPSISTSMIPEARSTRLARWRCCRRTAPSGNAVSTTAGTNRGTSGAAYTPVRCRDWRRHVNNCCGASPCRRATSETTAPGTSVSSIIRVLSSAENHRRRPVPVITSSRRAVVASGLSVWSSIDTTRSPIQRSSHSPIVNVRKRCGQNTAYEQQARIGHRRPIEDFARVSYPLVLAANRPPRVMGPAALGVSPCCDTHRAG